MQQAADRAIAQAGYAVESKIPASSKALCAFHTLAVAMTATVIQGLAWHGQCLGTALAAATTTVHVCNSSAPTFLKRKKSIRTALSNSKGGRKIWKNRKVGRMPSHTVRALLKWLRLTADESTANKAPAGQTTRGTAGVHSMLDEVSVKHAHALYSIHVVRGCFMWERCGRCLGKVTLCV